MPSVPVPRGFTLVELLAVLAVIAIGAAIAFPRLEGMVARARGRGALDQLSADLYLARTLAVREGTRTVLRFQRSTDRPECHHPTYSLVVRSTPERTVRVTDLRLGRSTCLRLGTVDSLVFTSRGLPTGGLNRKVFVETRGHTDSLTFSLLGRTFRWY